LALVFPSASWLLVEAKQRRAEFLRAAVAELRVDARVQVLEERAEVVGRDPGLRGRLDVVVARSFGPPAVVAECGAPLLRPGGRAVVSEPPSEPAPRWADSGLGLLGMAARPEVVAGGARFRVLVQVEPCPERYPRRTGIPAKRPLF
jgi:16S rRNA (guanine527-N7)-methyltransferase